MKVLSFHQWSAAEVELANAALATLAQNNSNICSLELSYFQRFSDEGLLSVAQFLPALHTFIAKYCQVSHTGLAILRANCTKLTTLEVYHRQRLTFHDVSSHVSLWMLTTLTTSTTTLNDALLRTIAQANPNIHTLCINSMVTMAGPVLSCSALCKALSHWHQLTTFDVTMFQFSHYSSPFALRLEDSVLYALVQNCAKVTNVHISGHINLRNNSISALANLPSLRVLNTSQCANLSDSGLVAIAQHCSQLEEVNFSFCPRITNVGIYALAQSCRNLASVTLWYSKQRHSASDPPLATSADP